MVAEHIHTIQGSVHKVVEAMPDGITGSIVKFVYWLFIGSVISLVTGKALKNIIAHKKSKKK